MQIKKGVNTVGVQPAIWYAIGIAEMVYGEHGHPLVVTSLVEGVHMQNSFHYKGLAVDIRTRGLSNSDIHAILSSLVYELDHLGYDVILEDSHIHIEYDPKKDEAFQQIVD